MPLTSSLSIEMVLSPGPVLETLARSGVFLQTACGGVGRCGRCRVIVDSEAVNPPDAAERKLPGAAGFQTKVRRIGRFSLAIPVNHLHGRLAAQTH